MITSESSPGAWLVDDPSKFHFGLDGGIGGGVEDSMGQNVESAVKHEKG